MAEEMFEKTRNENVMALESDHIAMTQKLQELQATIDKWTPALTGTFFPTRGEYVFTLTVNGMSSQSAFTVADAVYFKDSPEQLIDRLAESLVRDTFAKSIKQLLAGMVAKAINNSILIDKTQ
jgi:hypothetical protein